MARIVAELGPVVTIAMSWRLLALPRWVSPTRTTRTESVRHAPYRVPVISG